MDRERVIYEWDLEETGYYAFVTTEAECEKQLRPDAVIGPNGEFIPIWDDIHEHMFADPKRLNVLLEGEHNYALGHETNPPALEWIPADQSVGLEFLRLVLVRDDGEKQWAYVTKDGGLPEYFDGGSKVPKYLMNEYKRHEKLASTFYDIDRSWFVEEATKMLMEGGAKGETEGTARTTPRI